MNKQVWFSPRAVRLHAVILVVVPGFMALCLWQLSRALGGNELSWAYVFEWPIFAAYAIYMWWRFVHEPLEGAPSAEKRIDHVVAAPNGDPASAARRAADAERRANEDAELAVYNEYLAQLAAQDDSATSEARAPRHFSSRPRSEVPGGGLEPPTSGSKGRRSAD